MSVANATCRAAIAPRPGASMARSSIILFGSYARNDWVDEPENGYLSDFDLLVIVSNEKLTDIADYWYVAEDKILHDPTIGRTVNIIVHDLAEVNYAIGRGEYFGPTSFATGWSSTICRDIRSLHPSRSRPKRRWLRPSDTQIIG